MSKETFFHRARRLTGRIRALFNSGNLDRDFDQELELHLAMLTERNVKSGMNPEEARRHALLRLGGRQSNKELHRETRGLPAFDILFNDLRYAFRTLGRNAGFSIFAVLIVGLGIGASATMFCVVNALLLHLPFSDPSRLVWISNGGGGDSAPARSMPVGHFLGLRDHAETLSGLAGYYSSYHTGNTLLAGVGEPLRLTGVPVTQNFFSVLGVQPLIGRTFTRDECQTKWEHPQSVIFSHDLWESRFASDPDIVGRHFRLNDSAVTVVGVMPPEFDFSSVFDPGSRIDVYLPLPLTDEVNSQGNSIMPFGRLRPGATLKSAQSELNVLAAQIRRTHPGRNFQPKIQTLQEHVSGRLRPALVVLACSVGMVMLIVCANLSNLLLARNVARQKEMAVRIALGAGRGRLIRQMLTESMTLSCCSAVVGLIVAVAATRILAHLHTFSIPLLDNVRLDLSAFGFTVALAVITGLIFGLIPSFQAPSVAVHESLKDTNRALAGSRRHNWSRNALVVSEVAAAYILLVGAGLLIQSFLRVLNVNLGFQPEKTVALRIDPSSQYSTDGQRNAYFDEAVRRAQLVPGVRAVGLTDVLPLGGDRTWGVGAKGQIYSKEHPAPFSFIRVISSGYPVAVGIPLRAGRYFTERDTLSSEPVILVNETLSRLLWAGREPIGQIMAMDSDRRVVGVVGDVRHRALEDVAGPEIYLPIHQTADYSSVYMVVRTNLEPATCVAAIRDALRPIEPNIPQNEFRTLQELVDRAVSPRRFVVVLLGGFSAFALVLAALGTYAVISYSVNQRTAELGIRMALGASAGDLRTQIMLQTISLAALGAVIGGAVAAIMARALTSLLFGVTSTDPVTFLGTFVILTGAAGLAGYVPALRASRIDPMTALRAT